MPIIHEFNYLKPKSMDEALCMLNDYKDRARILAGGTDLIVRMKDGLMTPDAVIDVKGIEELGKMGMKEGFLSIGALVTFTELIESDIVRTKFPLIWETAKTVASTGVRNRATMAGNICSAIPSLDSGPALLVYDAQVVVLGQDGERKIPIDEWFTGPKRCAIHDDEVLERILVPLPEEKNAGCYVRLGRYAGEDLAQAGVAVLLTEGNQFKVAYCAVGPVPRRAKEIENYLNSGRLSENLIEGAKKLVAKEISPITDIRATKEYRLHMAEIMLEKGIKAAVSRFAGKGPKYGISLV